MQTYPLGTHIGQYEIASNPMIGGMGVVYFCLDHGNDGRPVALKTFKPEYLPDRAARDRFLREGTAWVQLGRHPHIVCCYAVEYIDPTAFLVLELIAKEQGMDDASLRSWLGAPMPVAQALLFALQIARGMKHATEKIPGFVHRDLKPENVLVGADKLPGTNINRLRVTDFGLIKTVVADNITDVPINDTDDSKLNQVQFTRGAGTPLYMAPEQWKGEPVGVYTDIYALGCILYEILTGQRAASGCNISELQAAHCAGKLRPMPGDLSRELHDILTSSLALQPAKRYQSWEEVTGALEQAYEVHVLMSAPDEKAIEAESLDERKRAGWSYNAIGVAYKDMGKAKVALEYFEKALSQAHEIRDSGGECAALSNLGNVYSDFGDARMAIGFYEQSLVLDRKVGDRNGESISLTNLGVAYAALGDMSHAIQFFEQSLAIVREIGNRRGESNSLGNLGNLYVSVGEIRRAIRFFEQCLFIKQEVGDQRGAGSTLNNLGRAYAALDDARQAIEFYEQGLTVAREIGDRRIEGAILGNLGILYMTPGDMRRAIEFFEQRIEIAREVGDRHGEGAALSNLGTAYDVLGEARQAIGFYEQALVIDREIGDLMGLASVLCRFALLHALQGEPTRALPLAQEAVQIFTQVGHAQNVQRAQQLVEQLRQSIRN